MNYVAVYHIIYFMNYCSFHLSTYPSTVSKRFGKFLVSGELSAEARIAEEKAKHVVKPFIDN